MTTVVTSSPDLVPHASPTTAMVPPSSSPPPPPSSAPPSSLPPSPPSTPSSLPTTQRGKREKESSDEDSDEKKEDARTLLAAGPELGYQQVLSKRQKLKEKKRLKKEREARVRALEEGNLSVLLLADEEERLRVWTLNGIKPSPDDVDRALVNHPLSNPLLLELLGRADAHIATTDFSNQPPDLASLLRSNLRRLYLSLTPLTYSSVYTAMRVGLVTTN
jgi:hypothetical protein